MDFDTDIAIVGGGLNGPTLALALAQIGLRVTLIDRLPAATREDAAFDGRSYALALTSTRMLGALGIWEGVKPHAQPMLEIKVTDGRAGEGPSPFFMHFDHAEIEEGPMGHMVEDRHLRRALAEAVSADARITRLDGETVVAQDAAPSGITLTFADGKSLRARLVVGADGRASGTAMRAGIKRIGWGYAQTALVCAIAHEKPHHGIAHQFFMPPGPLAILPLTDNRSSSLAGARYTFPLSLSLAHAMMATRVALLGDAAHGVHPIAGQGLNAGMRDVAALAEVIADAHRRGQDIGSATVLEQYQLWRRFDNTALALATDSFNRLFSNDNPLLRLARDVGMAAINALPDARRGFMREAAGLTGTLPRLMQGKAL